MEVGAEQVNELISVIIPVYNVEKYLRECLDSVCAQTYRNLEIICVDDGSTDASGEICDEYARSDARVRVIHQKNGAASAARNAGLDAAKGSYISFVDSDDIIHPRFIETLYEGIQDTGAQIAACGYRRFTDGETPPEIEYMREKWFIWTQKEAIVELTKTSDHLRGEFVTVPCNKLFARKLFQTLRFPTDKQRDEDEFIILPLLLQIETLCVNPLVLYDYRQRRDSVTGAGQRIDPRQLKVLDAYKERCILLKGEEYRDIYADVVTNYFEMMCYLAFRVAKPVGKFGEVYRRYLHDLPFYWRWIRGKRFFLFAVNPYVYWLRHVRS